MNIKGIIFDKDGTLFDFQSSWGEKTFEFLKILSNGSSPVLLKLANALNFDLDQRLFHPNSIFIAGTTDETLALIQPIIPKKNKDFILTIHKECYANQKQIPVKNLFNVLHYLHKIGYMLGVVTNDLEQPTINQLRDGRILQFFSTVLGSDSGYGAKPKPSQLIEFQRRKGLLAREILMVGDSTHDMVAAKAAGMRSFAVLTGVASRSDLEPYAETVFDDISFLPNWLKKQKY